MNEAFTPSSVIHNGDCREVMATMAADSIDSIVTDPPYGLSFMGKEWDHGVPGVEFWVEALRVAKPGAYLLAFGGTRTYHRLACAIEDAGWEVRDCIAWVYGSGFPKSHDVSKAIDREAGAERGEEHPHPTNQCKGGQWCKCQTLDATGRYSPTKHPAITAPATDAAKQWAGWGTALKPAYEPIIVARKPLVGTVASNVMQYGTGGINVDGCRIETVDNLNGGAYSSGEYDTTGKTYELGLRRMDGKYQQPSGRWPANFIHDGSDEVVGLFPDSKSIGGTNPLNENEIYGKRKSLDYSNYGDSGSAARFFYCAKASKADRDAGCEGMEERLAIRYGEKAQGPLPQQTPSKPVAQRNHHPTVKPTDLMRYLCRLVTPPGGTVLDPFCGSGSTGKGAILEGFNFIGIERKAEYVEIAKSRTEWARKNYHPTLF